MSADRVVYVCTMPFYSRLAAGRFKDASVLFGQLLLEGDPIVEATLVDWWKRVGTADAATAQLISSLGSLATMDRLFSRLGPLPVLADAETEALFPAERGAAEPTLADEYLSLAEIEADRLKLALAGQPHGYDALAKRFGKGARSTIQRRYKGLQPPGSPIPGVCDETPTHTHPRV